MFIRYNKNLEFFEKLVFFLDKKTHNVVRRIKKINNNLQKE